MRRTWTWWGVALLMAGCAPGMTAQAPSPTAARVAAVANGTVRFSFAAREGVCGSMNGWYTMGTTYTSRTGRAVREIDPQCPRSLVRISLDRENGRTVAVRTYVGSVWAATAEGTDLGTVPAGEGADVLLGLAETSDAKVAEHAMQGVTLADSVNRWQRLAALARNDKRPVAVRKSATFWMAQAAGNQVVGTLSDLAQDDGDLEVRKQAVFALSQRPQGEGVPALMNVARNRDMPPAVRKQAYFWLGQSGDPRAVTFLEDALAKP